MKLHSLQQNWNRLARQDPLRAILGRPGQGTDWEVREFFRTGMEEIREVADYASDLGVPARWGRALDFGCGAGRLTQALSGYFEEAVGVDIAPAMIDLANDYGKPYANCRFVLNERDDLAVFEDASFDLIYSNITLQHIPPAISKNYLAEFIRLLAPGGLLLFHLPSRRRKGFATRLLPTRLYSACSRTFWRLLHPGQPWIEMHGIARDEVISWVESSGGQVLDVQSQHSAGDEWETYRHAVTRF